jgi:amidase
VAGIPLTRNSYVMDGFIPDFDASVATRVLEAGGRMVGKNTMNGFTGGKGWGGAAGGYWAPRNPHDPGHVTGGSSSGCAAAVAAGQVDVEFGGDVGGSVRVPAAFCGVVGLKATYGLIPNTGVAVDSDQSVDNVGPMGRYVEHVAAALEAVAGYDGFDPRQGRQVPESLTVVRRLGDGISGLKIGVLEEGFGAVVDPDVHNGVLAAIDTLAGLGATVTRVHVPVHRTVASAAAGIWAEGGRALRDTTIFGACARHLPSGSAL